MAKLVNITETLAVTITDKDIAVLTDTFFAHVRESVELTAAEKVSLFELQEECSNFMQCILCGCLPGGIDLQQPFLKQHKQHLLHLFRDTIEDHFCGFTREVAYIRAVRICADF